MQGEELERATEKAVRAVVCGVVVAAAAAAVAVAAAAAAAASSSCTLGIL
jgi:hypothetical protein